MQCLRNSLCCIFCTWLIEYALQAVKEEIKKQISEEENNEMSEAEKKLLLKGLCCNCNTNSTMVVCLGRDPIK